jgi:hypothetical protein
MKRLTETGIAAISLIWASAPANAQTQPPKSAEETINVLNNPAIDSSLFEFSYASPNSPALPLIGVAGDQITRVDSIRKFGVSLLAGGNSSTAGPAIALDVSPFWLLLSRPTSLWDYRRFGKFKRVVARSKFGVAASRGEAAKSRPSSLVVTLSTKLLDGQDQLFASDFDDCVTKGPLDGFAKEILAAGAAAAVGKSPSEIGAAVTASQEAKTNSLVQKIEEAHAKCVTNSAIAIATKPSFDVGLGLRLSGEPGQFRKLGGAGTIFWGTFATGVIGRRNNAQDSTPGPLGALNIRGLVHARYTLKESIFNDQFLLQGKRNTIMLVAGLETVPAAGQSEKLRLALQGGWNRQNTVLPTETDKDFWRFLANANVQLVKGIWGNLAVGHVTGRGVEKDTYFQFGFSFSPPSKSSKINDYYQNRR